MKAIRIFLLVLIIIGLGLILTQNLWVPSVVDFIIQNQNSSKGGVAPLSSTNRAKPVIKAAQITSQPNSQCPEGTWPDADVCILLGTTTPQKIISYPVEVVAGKDFSKNVLSFGSTTIPIDRSKLTVLPAYSFKSVTFSRTSNEYSQQTWSRFGDFTFHLQDGSVEIYKNGLQIDEIKSWDWDVAQGFYLDIVTFILNNRYYFVIGGSNCGNGGCTDNSIVYSVDLNETKGRVENIWEHNWTWGHGDQPITGFQGHEKFDSAIVYDNYLFLFSNAGSFIKMDMDGGAIEKEESQ